MRGQVVWYNRAKGYGFIKAENMPDVFVHIKDLEKGLIFSLNPDDTVEFEIGKGPSGKECARNIRFIAPGKPENLHKSA